MALSLDLGGDWEFAEGDPSSGRAPRRGWAPARVPGTVHQDLIAQGRIPDPHRALGEAAARWVEERDWWYRRSFTLPAGFAGAPAVRLKAEGLDTWCEIRVNGRPLGRAANMFVPHVFSAAGFLRPGANQILLHFESPLRALRRLERLQGRLSAVNENLRVHGRKAAYSFGWDWGPRLPTSGIFRPLTLEIPDEPEAEGLWIRTLEAGPRRARGEFRFELVSAAARSVRVRASLAGWAWEGRKRLRPGSNAFALPWTLERPELWWPRGLGAPALHTATLELDGVEAARLECGIRTVELERVRDARGAGFGFKVNGAPVFAKGANWIPADSFLPRVSRPRVEALVDRAYEANYTMLRVWGGGVYEDEAFYGACDRKGLLVWQDFPFACGEAPEAPAFLAQVREEASSALKRLRRHPSLALLCGNNENHMARHDRWFGAASAKRWGRPIYHRTLPQVCARQAPGIPYWPGSPYGGSDPNDPGEGDRHHWAVWAHFAAPEEYLKDEGRFLSEFGFAALPGRAALADALGPRGRWPEGPELPAHDKVENGGGLGRIAYYLSGRLPQARDLDSLRYLSQTLQARVLKAGVEHWRRLKPHTQGALVWQHNDCWPAVSWSLLDGRDEPKLAYHAIAAAFEDIHLSAVESAGLAEFWLSCDGLSPQGTLRVERWNVRGREAVLLRSRARGSALKGVRVFRATRAQAGIIDPSRQFLAAFWEGPQGLRRRALLFFAQPLRLALTRPQARLAARVCDGVWMLELRAATLTLACEVSGPSPSGFSDNGFDLLPGERREITWKGAPPGRPPRWSLRTLNALVVHG